MILSFGAVTLVGLGIFRAMRAVPKERIAAFLLTIIIGFPIVIGLAVLGMILIFVGVGILSGGNFL